MPKILVIEDNPVEIQTIKSRLEKNHFEVLTARTGEEGIDIARRHKPDLIFMDMILPGMHGLEATIKLKNDPQTKEIPIVALTVMDASGFVASCFKEGIAAFIRKPYDFDEIFDRTEKILGIPRARRQKTILVMEREPSVATMITLALMKKGYHVVTSTNGEIPSSRDLEDKPDLILLGDIEQPEGGWDFPVDPGAKSSVPLILVTQEQSPERIEAKMNEWGAEDYIVKPFSIKELMDKAERLLEKRKT